MSRLLHFHHYESGEDALPVLHAYITNCNLLFIIVNTPLDTDTNPPTIRRSRATAVLSIIEIEKYNPKQDLVRPSAGLVYKKKRIVAHA